MYRIVVSAIRYGNTVRKIIMEYKLNYKEEPVKDDPLRKDYLNGINCFIEKTLACAMRKRAEYITPEKLAKARERYRKEYLDMLGYPLNTEDIRLERGEKTFVSERNGVKIYRTVITAAGIPIYGMYFEVAKNAPFIVCIHGGEGSPELISGVHLDSSNYGHLAQRLVERGCNVYCPQLLLWNLERYGVPFNRREIDGKLRQLGGGITALEVMLLMRSIDYFIQYEGIDRERIGTTGLSYGGMYALALAAADKRIKSCYAVCQFNDRFKYSWADWSYLGSQFRFTDVETAALVAPRALCIAVGDKDEIFDYDSAVSEAEKVPAYYRAANASDRFDFYVFDGLHEVDRADRGIDFLLKYL